MDEKRAHVFFQGMVQGVFFRQNIKEKAEGLGVNGWAKNLANGKVEAVFEGRKQDILNTIEWLKQRPFPCRVDDIDIQWEEYKNEFSDFVIKR